MGGLQQRLNLCSGRGTFNGVGSLSRWDGQWRFFVPLQPQLMLQFLCSVPPDGCHSFSHHLPFGGWGIGRKNRSKKGSVWGWGGVDLSSNSHLDFVGLNCIKCLLLVSGDSGRAVVSVGVCHSLQIHIWCQGSTRWSKEQLCHFVRLIRTTTTLPGL